MSEYNPDLVGVDVSKDFLDAHRLRDGVAKRYANDPGGIRALLRWIGPQVRGVVYEPSGPYHRGLEQALLNAGMTALKANPRRAREFARAAGRLAKTDRADAECLARMGAALPLRPVKPRSKQQQELAELTLLRDSLVRQHVAEINRSRQLQFAYAKRVQQQCIRHLARKIAQLDRRIAELAQADPDMAHGLALLTSIPGIGHQNAVILLTDMPELGQLSPKAVGSLAGLAPVARDSGLRSGQRHIQGGRPRVRRSLYMAALSAIRCAPPLKIKYQRMRNAGKPPKVAIVAIMRNLAVLANHLLAENRPWSPEPPRRAACAS